MTEEGLRRATLLGLKMGEGATSHKVLVASEARKGKETDSP